MPGLSRHHHAGPPQHQGPPFGVPHQSNLYDSDSSGDPRHLTNPGNYVGSSPALASPCSTFRATNPIEEEYGSQQAHDLVTSQDMDSLSDEQLNALFGPIWAIDSGPPPAGVPEHLRHFNADANNNIENHQVNEPIWEMADHPDHPPPPQFDRRGFLALLEQLGRQDRGEQLEQGQISTSYIPSGPLPTLRRMHTGSTTSPASTQVQSVKCGEPNCTRNYRPTNPDQRFCTRHQDKYDRNNAPHATFWLMEDVDSTVAHDEVYPQCNGISPVDNDGSGDDVDARLEVEWMRDLLAAVSKPYLGGGENEAFRIRQQGVYNGKRYDNRTVNIRMRLLFQAALTFHRGGKAVYPRGGDNDGYGNPDESLIFSERMREIIKILQEDKRVCMDIIEGRGVTALVANPLKYEKRKTQNKQSNETKQKKQRLGEEVEEERRQKRVNTYSLEGIDRDGEEEDFGREQNDDIDADAGPAIESRGRKRKRATKPRSAKGKNSSGPVTRSQTGQVQSSEQQRVATAEMWLTAVQLPAAENMFASAATPSPNEEQTMQSYSGGGKSATNVGGFGNFGDPSGCVVDGMDDYFPMELEHD